MCIKIIIGLKYAVDCIFNLYGIVYYAHTIPQVLLPIQFYVSFYQLY